MIRRFTYRMTEETAKKLKTYPLTIGTHNGCFHADEALAIYMLQLLPHYKNFQLVRSRDPAHLSTCHTVVDVGGEYNSATNRYDHHQRSFDVTFPNRFTKLSSAGLVYLHFGKAIIAQHLGKSSEDEQDVHIIWEKLYQDFIEALDANDNGISVYDEQQIAAAGLQKRFNTNGFTLGAMVSRLNPSWNDSRLSDPIEAQKAEDELFLAASTRIGEEFYRELNYLSKSWLPARDIVQKSFEKRFVYDSRGRILVFEAQSVPWKDHLFEIEMESTFPSKVLYVIYPEKSTKDSKWKIQCVPESRDSFQSRKPLPEAWRGLREAELDQVSGIWGGIFVHAAGFIGGHETFEGVTEMATRALNL